MTGRSEAVDTFRGLAIVGMVFVNDQGSPNGWRQLQHAPWNGCRLADLVFPGFLFIMGAALSLSPRRPTVARILRRAVLLVAIGVVLNWVDPLTGGALRYPGVLQRIGLAYLVAALIVGWLPTPAQVAVGGLLLGGYAWALLHVSVPHVGAGVLTPAGNVAGWVDRSLFGQQHLYRHTTYDPEGFLSTTDAVVTTLLGAWAGLWVRWRGRRSDTSLALVVGGGALLGLGWWWSGSIPFNKRMWTPSYTLWTAGWLLIALALLWQLVEVRRWRWLGQPWAVLGFNALMLYLLTELGDRALWVTHVGALPTHVWVYQHWFAPHWSAAVASAGYSVAFVAVAALVSSVLYWRGVSLRL